MSSTPWKRRLAILIFALGLLCGIALAGMIAWGDMEATMFDAAISADEPLSTLRCPVLITTAETTTVSAAFRNPDDQPINLLVRAHISAGFVTWMREVSLTYLLPAAFQSDGTILVGA